MTHPPQEPAPEPAPAAPPAPATDALPGPPAAVAAGELDWHRMHPVSPALRAWKTLAVAAVFGGQSLFRDVVVEGGDLPGGRQALIASGIVAVVVVLVLVAGVLSWLTTRYAVDDESVRLHTGVVFRQQRSAQLDRVQAVDVVRPLLSRLLGFAEVRVEVAGGAGSALRLASLRRADAERLQEALLVRSGLAPDQAPGGAPERDPGGAPGSGPGVGRAAGPGPWAPPAALDPGEGDPVPTGAPASTPSAAPPPGGARPHPGPASDALPVLTVPMPRLVGSVALGTAPTVLVVVGAALVGTSAALSSVGPLLAAGPMLLGVAGSIWGDLTRGGGWTVSRTPAGLRIQHGLLDRRSQTVPRGRVQAVRVSQPPFWRRLGWWRVEVNVAGYAGESQDEGERSSRVVPVCSRADLDLLLALVLPDGVPAGLEAGLTGTSRTKDAGGWVTAPRRSRWLDPVAWRRHGVLVGEDSLLVRRGAWWRALDVVPHGRSQSLAVHQGPLQRRMGLASFLVHSTAGPVTPVVEQLDLADAERLVLAQARRTAPVPVGRAAPAPAGRTGPA